ncbi:MAG: hypothetical protein OEQ74_05855 [Gammaproteobacteria bacterium]|nr:hypothetical protein [Gammaproteobacteria bacterium]
MNKLLILLPLAVLLMITAPVSHADETKFGAVAPRAEHGRYQHSDQYDRRYRRDHRSSRHYRTNRNYSRYRHRRHADYVYRPFPAPSRYSRYDRYNRYRYDHGSYYHYRGDGIRISPYGLTIFLDFDD